MDIKTPGAPHVAFFIETLTEFSAVTSHFKKTQYKTFLILASHQILCFKEKALLYANSTTPLYKVADIVTSKERSRRSVLPEKDISTEVNFGERFFQVRNGRHFIVRFPFAGSSQHGVGVPSKKQNKTNIWLPVVL